MDDTTENTTYVAFSIPRREPRPQNGAAVSRTREGATDMISPGGVKFAEIEFEPGSIRAAAANVASHLFPPSAPPQKITRRTADPIRQKFYDMRSISVSRPFIRDDSELFYRQAKFMEDFSDDYEDSAGFFMYFPNYQQMGYEQLRTYFTWRTRARRGEMRTTSVSYAFLYVYELLSGIGVGSAADGLDKLVALWQGFGEYGQAFENYMPLWLKDYHVYYELPHSFIDFINEHNLQKYYSLPLIFATDTKNSLELWNAISSYDITKSNFYSGKNVQLLNDCFDVVLDAIRQFCANRGARFEDLIIYSISRKAPWAPFRRALFYDWLRQPDRQVTFPGQEYYYCKNGRWLASLPIYFSSQKGFVGHIIKKTESCLRNVMNYKYKLSVGTKYSDNEPFRELKVISAKLADLDSVIEHAVDCFYRNLTRAVVTVDHANLERIRKEALGTQSKLTVPENDGQDTAVSAPEYHDPPVSVARVGDSWSGLRDALSVIELEALTIALRDGASLKAFADGNGIMLEVLVDGINEKASDHIGDSILELDGGVTVFDEYIHDVARMADGT
ncbi:MAG: TerB N-terminal domain-containing protein [Oscillospiraceae bacterium]|nr:TerB N-terminal domain-containing protein [Oscillospiraceae bacterium]